jgi:hypothetical protein
MRFYNFSPLCVFYQEQNITPKTGHDSVNRSKLEWNKKKWVTKPRSPEIGRPSESFWSGHYKRQAVCQMTYKGWNNDSSIKATTFAVCYCRWCKWSHAKVFVWIGFTLAMNVNKGLYDNDSNLIFSLVHTTPESAASTLQTLHITAP